MSTPDTNAGNPKGTDTKSGNERPPVGSLTDLKIRRVFSVPLSEEPLDSSLSNPASIKNGEPETMLARPSVEEKETARILKKSKVDREEERGSEMQASQKVERNTERAYEPDESYQQSIPKQEPETAETRFTQSAPPLSEKTDSESETTIPGVPSPAKNTVNGTSQNEKVDKLAPDATAPHQTTSSGESSLAAHGPNRRIQAPQSPQSQGSTDARKNPIGQAATAEPAEQKKETLDSTPIAALPAEKCKESANAPDSEEKDPKSKISSLAQRALMRAEAALATRPARSEPRSEAPKKTQQDKTRNRQDGMSSSQVPDDILVYWSQQRKAQAYPRVGDMDTASIRRLWPNSLLIRCANDQSRFEPIVNFAKGGPDVDLSPELVLSKVDPIDISPMMLNWLMELAREVMTAGRPAESRDSFPVSTGPSEFWATALPLSSDGQKIDHVLCHFAAL